MEDTEEDFYSCASEVWSHIKYASTVIYALDIAIAQQTQDVWGDLRCFSLTGKS